MKKSGIKNLDINIFSSRQAMGDAAGKDVESEIISLLRSKKEIRMIFAAAPSQNEMLSYLAQSKNIEWDRITAFNMDEYLGLAAEAPQLFSAFLKEHLFDKIRLKNLHLINGLSNAEIESEHFSYLISKEPIDIVCLGIGENGHIAFNDPHTADFYDPRIIKRVELDNLCRSQQVSDGSFASINDVPIEALTLTIPVLMSAKKLFCVVPGQNKRKAVYNTINGPVSTTCPASILQKHPDCRFYFDEGSFNNNLRF
jgi:glucosamine-6-phosphate deaminase